MLNRDYTVIVIAISVMVIVVVDMVLTAVVGDGGCEVMVASCLCGVVKVVVMVTVVQ